VLQPQLYLIRPTYFNCGFSDWSPDGNSLVQEKGQEVCYLKAFLRCRSRFLAVVGRGGKRAKGED